MSDILLLQGPNLNLLGQRETSIYGTLDLASIHQQAQEQTSAHNVSLECIQSNSEAALVDAIHQAKEANVSLIVINPAAFTHTSVALRDALLGVAIPFIEVHLSNPHAREDFRRHSFFSDKALGVVAGFGADSYRYALDAAIHHIKQS